MPVIVHVLDNLSYYFYARGFSDGLHEGIVSLMILHVNPHRPLHTVVGGFATAVFLARVSAACKTPA
jgi:hypothetical protein